MFCREKSPWRSELRQSKSKHFYRPNVSTVLNTCVIMTCIISFFFNLLRLLFRGSIGWSQCALKMIFVLCFIEKSHLWFCMQGYNTLNSCVPACIPGTVKQVTHYWERLNVLCTVIIHQLYEAIKSCDNSLFMTNPVMRSENGKKSSIHLT